MKRPEISRNSSDPDLVGSNETSSWVAGRNCVYRDSQDAEYRVSIQTARGWRSYGHFNDLETATYVANIAILVEGCEEKYELNTEIGEKDRIELERWRQHPGNSQLEKFAADRHKRYQAELAVLRERERAEAAKSAEERRRREAISAEQRKRDEEAAAERHRIYAEKARAMYELSNPELVKLIKSTSVHDPLYKDAMDEAVRRYNKLGLPRAT